ncbi:MAG TPA: DUF4238 domain-containing protein [Acidobacteriaceae bacterium]|nr:DUF4238 domain-containing protein [Acidobacteriaceae bacterium]
MSELQIPAERVGKLQFTAGSPSEYQASVAKLREQSTVILRDIFSTNTAFGVFANRESAPLRVVSAPPGLKFITGDQPIINTYAAFIDEATPVDDLELYFPVSPTHAAIISSHHAYQNTHGKELDAFRVNYLNQAMELQAHDQLFASTKEELQILASTFK